MILGEKTFRWSNIFFSFNQLIWSNQTTSGSIVPLVMLPPPTHTHKSLFPTNPGFFPSKLRNSRNEILFVKYGKHCSLEKMWLDGFVKNKFLRIVPQVGLNVSKFHRTCIPSPFRKYNYAFAAASQPEWNLWKGLNWI